MNKLKYEEAKSLVENYRSKEKIQVLVFVRSNSTCHFCSSIISDPKNSMSQLEDAGYCDVNVIEIDDAYGFFKPPYNFLMYYYIPWNEQESPQIRDSIRPFQEMVRDMKYFVEKKDIQ